MSLFDEINRLEKLSRLGDPLNRLNQAIEWEMFRPILEGNKGLRKFREDRRGRPAYDVVLMFKILILQRSYNLGDDRTEFMINDRMTFMRFLGLAIGDHVPDAKTIWLFREKLTKTGMINDLFLLFNKKLEKQHLISHSGTLVDATFVDAPRQRNNREENKSIKKGEIPEEWTKEENANKIRQKDMDARWAKKNNETHYGYKNHIKVDSDSKFITKFTVTSANVHDSQELAKLIDDTDQILYADSAYTGEELLSSLPDTLELQINEKGTRKHPLTEEQKENNRKKSKIRSRVEHVFGFMTVSMCGLTIRTIGRKRAEFNIGLTNLIYNIRRYETRIRMDSAKA